MVAVGLGLAFTTLVIYFVIPTSLQTMLNAEKQKQPEFENVIYSTHVIYSDSSLSLILCTSACFDDLRCMSFSYNAGCSWCTLYSVVFGSSEHASPSPGFLYYIAGNKALCPIQNGFFHFRSANACHKFIVDKRYSFEEAENLCFMEGGHLSKFDDELERQKIVDVILASDGYDKRYYTGVRRDGPGNTWVWRDGTSANNAAYWRPGEPRNDGDCAYMCADRPACQWNDAQCLQYYAMCEIDQNKVNENI